MTNNAILDPQMLFIKNLYFSISILEKCIPSSFNKLFTYHPPINPPKSLQKTPLLPNRL